MSNMTELSWYYLAEKHSEGQNYGYWHLCITSQLRGFKGKSQRARALENSSPKRVVILAGSIRHNALKTTIECLSDRRSPIASYRQSAVSGLTDLESKVSSLSASIHITVVGSTAEIGRCLTLVSVRIRFIPHRGRSSRNVSWSVY